MSEPDDRALAKQQRAMEKQQRQADKEQQLAEKEQRQAEKEQQQAEKELKEVHTREQLLREQERLEAERDVIDRFNVVWYERRISTWQESTSWMGIPTQQCPTDLWVYQELLVRTRPEVFVEVGIKRGGLTRYVADMLELLHPGDPEAGRVVAVDLTLRDVARGAVGSHPRVTLVEGSSVAEEVIEHVRAVCNDRKAMVLLDSDHTAKHVRAELELYSPLVGVGNYLIVNDTNINGHPAAPDWGPGPYEAVVDFLSTTGDFEVDRECEKHMLTACPNGYLRRVG